MYQKKLPLPKSLSEKPGTPYGPSPYGTRLLGYNICIYDDITNRKNYTEKKVLKKKHKYNINFYTIRWIV